MNTRGFTLLEVLVSIAIAGILLTTLMSFMSSTNDTAAQTAQASTALRELQNGGAILADDVRLARLIYPAARSITLDSAYPATVTNPATGTNIWETQPTGTFFAMILPSGAGNCSGTTSEFVAYYLIRRSSLTNLPLTDWGNPGPDPANDDKFVLMRYGTCLSSAPASTASLPTSVSGGEGRLVVDYVGTAGMNITPSQVTATLVGLRTVKGRDVRVPAANATPNTVYVSATARNRN